MNLLTALIRRSALRRPARRPCDSPVPWDADAFPHHTVRRSIELAAMVAGRDGGWQGSPTSRRQWRRTVLLFCAVAGLGLVLLSLAQGVRQQSPMPDEKERPGRRSVHPKPEGRRRHVSAVA